MARVKSQEWCVKSPFSVDAWMPLARQWASWKKGRLMRALMFSLVFVCLALVPALGLASIQESHFTVSVTVVASCHVNVPSAGGRVSVTCASRRAVAPQVVEAANVDSLTVLSQVPGANMKTMRVRWVNVIF
jgi:hypothetical protein